MDLEKLAKEHVALIGILSDANSSFMRGAASAPPAIRRVLRCGSANLCSELGVNLKDNPRFVDVGDHPVADDNESFLAIEAIIRDVLDRGAAPLVLGGDHAISYPVLKAVHRVYGVVNILHFDAHPDLYDDYEGNPYSHASPFARILEDGLCRRLTQVGVRTLNRHLCAQIERFGVEVHEMRSLDLDSIGRDFEGPVYISCDLDALDPAYAPGVSHHEPGGLSVRDILHIIQRLPNRIAGADIVEYNPRRDVNDMTAMVAAKLLKEIAGRMLLSNG